MTENKKNKLSEAQARAVMARKNAVVCAGAGSGKTMVLSERYFSLVKEGLGIESILTLTFTRKAAAEMYARIYRRLREADDPAILAQAKQFDKANISTLDSFCAGILRGAANRYGIAPSFSLDEGAARELLSALSLRFLLENQNRPALRRLFRENEFEAVLSGFGDVAGNYLILGCPRDFPAMHKTQMSVLLVKTEEKKSETLSIFRAVLGLEADGSKSAAGLIELQKKLNALGGPEKIAYNEIYFSEALNYAAGQRKPGRVSSPVLIAYKEAIDSLRRIREEYGAIAETLARRDELEDLYRLLEEFQSRVEKEKRLAGILTFTDCAALAVKSLQEDTRLREYCKAKFRAVMIDEFQDNNELQKNLLYLLAEDEKKCREGIPAAADLDPGKLFFVGDEKQSIYRFRGADVRVFKSLADELEAAGGELVRLDTNYRSMPGLIRFFNELFSRVMDGSASEFDARFEALTPRDGGDVFTPQAALFYKPYAEKEPGEASPDDAEAWFIAEKIHGWVKNKSLPVWDREKGAARPAEYRDFALLMKSTGSQIRYETAFRRFDIPYTATGIRSLFLEAPANDIYSILQCAVYPEDRLAYAALLRSPFVNLSSEAALQILLEKKPPFQAESEAGLEPGDREKFNLGRELYTEVCRLAGENSVPALLSYLWREGGYRYTVLREARHHPYLELYEYLREFALSVPGESLARFLDRVRPNLGQYERIPDLEIQRDESAGVKIMTIHKSKGLEFPVVFVANCGNMGRREGRSSVFYPTRDYGLSCNLGGRGEKFNYFFRLGEEEAKAAELAELRRLLYVACTRAESHIFLSGCFTKTNQGENALSLLTLVCDALRLERDGSSTACDVCTVELIPGAAENVVHGRLPAGKRLPPEAARAEYTKPAVRRRAAKREYSATELQALFDEKEKREQKSISGEPAEPGDKHFEENEALPSSLDGGAETRDNKRELYFGSLCHKVIELFPAGGAFSGSGSLVLRPAADIAALRPLEAACPEKEDYGALLAEAIGFAEKFFASPFSRELFAGATQAPQAELAFTLRIDTEDALDAAAINAPAENFILVNGVMDMVVHLPEKTVVVDFKTDKAVRPEAHAVQLALYRLAAQEIWGKKPESFLYYLRSGNAVLSEEGLPPLREEVLR